MTPFTRGDADTVATALRMGILEFYKITETTRPRAERHKLAIKYIGKFRRVLKKIEREYPPRKR